MITSCRSKGDSQQLCSSTLSCIRARRLRRVAAASAAAGPCEWPRVHSVACKRDLLHCSLRGRQPLLLDGAYVMRPFTGAVEQQSADQGVSEGERPAHRQGKLGCEKGQDGGEGHVGREAGREGRASHVERWPAAATRGRLKRFISGRTKRQTQDWERGRWLHRRTRDTAGLQWGKEDRGGGGASTRQACVVVHKGR